MTFEQIVAFEKIKKEMDVRNKLLMNQIAKTPVPVTVAEFDMGVTLNEDGSANVKFVDLRGVRAALVEFEAVKNEIELRAEALEGANFDAVCADLEAETVEHVRTQNELLEAGKKIKHLEARLFEMQNAAIEFAKKALARSMVEALEKHGMKL